MHRAERRPRIEVFTLGSAAGFERLIAGKAIGQRIGVGPARRLWDSRDLARLKPGEVLVTSMTDPDWEPVMKRAAAIVTDRGGRTCHAAIVSRELGVPCAVGTERATEVLPEGETVTVSCAEGEVGTVYRGAAPFERRTVELTTLPPRATRVMLNVGNPGEAFKLGTLPADGVGLARIEFIIASVVKIHPLALLHPDRVDDPASRAAIDALTRGYTDRADYFVDRLAEGVGIIAAAFYPRDVIVRLSDFKSNEYAGLLGGKGFEPVEANPMLGFRGASRYAHPGYRDGFALECRAMRRVREEMGLTNVKLMIPFCRTPEEGERVVALMAQHGLRRGEQGLEIYVMCEIPSNVLLAREFARTFDGFSIGSNDLTQLVQGVDRDSELVAPIFDERNPAVLAMVAAVIDAASSADRARRSLVAQPLHRRGRASKSAQAQRRLAMVGEICSRPAVTVSPDTTAQEAAHRMRSRKVGAVAVDNRSGSPMGVVTDRDITVHVVAQGTHPATVRVGMLIKRKPTVIREDAGVFEATKLLSRRGIRRLPVMSKAGKLVGMISLDDLLMLLGSELGHIASTLASELGRTRI